ncbi:MAG: winged helix-turn-helix domain-containing protein [Oscillospiraceae bacterium]|nr:winged helix-turn-helix domain-containing protein [Oscillospiraceae bacterium]
MKEIININMLGGFSISYGGHVISDMRSRPRKAWLLLEYLIAHRNRVITQDELIAMLWPLDDVDDAVNTLKTLLHRVRALLSGLDLGSAKQVVAYHRGTYAWAPRLPCVVDADEFTRLCKSADDPDVSAEDKLSILTSAVETYGGRFLPNHVHEPWVASLDAQYHSLYTEAVYALTDALRSKGRMADVAAICRRASALDPYNEELHIRLIRALAASGEAQNAISHYDYITELFYNGFGITPSKDLTAIYSELVKTTRVRELNLSAIKDDLRESGADDGCLFVEYEFFKIIYRLEARSEARTGQVVYLALVTVTDQMGERPVLKTLKKTMDKLKETISQSLRRGDVFTRFSVSQYLILLPAATFEDGQTVTKRIAKQFKRDNPRIRTELACSLQAVTPADLETLPQSQV